MLIAKTFLDEDSFLGGDMILHSPEFIMSPVVTHGDPRGAKNRFRFSGAVFCFRSVLRSYLFGRLFSIEVSVNLDILAL